MLREIVLDTETTGLDPNDGHRLVEIGCVELTGGIKTGRTFQAYINPERAMPPEATRIHGITDDFLKDKPKFAEVANDFLKFIEGARLVIHNAQFDMKFLNWELGNAKKELVSFEIVTDTLDMARKKFPGSPASLDALCKRFSVSNEHRKYHGALLDSELLAEVYIALTGGKQASMEFAAEEKIEVIEIAINKERPFRQPRNFYPSEEEKLAHQEFIKTLRNPLWSEQNSVVVENKAA